MKAQDESISKVLDWFSRSSETDDRSPSVGLMEESKNSSQQILIHTGASRKESGSSIDKLPSTKLSPQKSQSISDYDLPNLVGKPESELLTSTRKNIRSDQSSVPNVELTTPVDPTEVESIPLQQVPSNLKAEETLEFGKSGGGCGKMHNQATSDDSLGKDQQFQVVTKQDVFEKENEGLQIELEATPSKLNSGSLVKVEAGGIPVYSREKEQDEIGGNSAGPPILEQSESLQNSKRPELEKLNIPKKRVSDIKQFWESDRPSQTKKSITPRSCSLDSDQSGSSIVSFKKVILEEEEDDHLSPIEQLKSFWENEKSTEIVKGHPNRPSKSVSLETEKVSPVADPKPTFGKRHTFHYFSQSEQITGPEDNASESTNESGNDQQKSFKFQSLRSFWNVDSKSKGIDSQVQTLSETSNRQFNSNPDIRSKDPFITKAKTKLASKSLEDVRDGTKGVSQFQPYDPKPECTSGASISSKSSIEKSDGKIDSDDLMQKNETVFKRFSAPKHEFDSRTILTSPQTEVLEARRPPSVECKVKNASPALPYTHSNLTLETKQDKVIPTLEMDNFNNPESVQNPGYRSEDNKPEINKQPHLVTSLQLKTYVDNLRDSEPSLEERDMSMHPRSAEEVLENPSCDTNLNKLNNKYSEFRCDQLDGTEMIPSNQVSVQSRVNKLKKPLNSDDSTLQENSLPSDYLKSYNTVSDETLTKPNPEMASEKLTEVSEVVLKSFSPRKAELSVRLQKLRDELSDNNSSLLKEQKSTSSSLNVMLSSNQIELQDEENGERIHFNILSNSIPKMFLVKQNGFDNGLTLSPVDPDVSGSITKKDQSESVCAVQKDESSSSEVPINESIERTETSPPKSFSDFDKVLQKLYNESLDAPSTPNGNMAKNEDMEIQELDQGVGKIFSTPSSEICSKVQRSSSTDKATSYQPLILTVSSKKVDVRNEDMSRPPKKSGSATQRTVDVPDDILGYLVQEERSNLPIEVIGSTSGLRNSSESPNVSAETSDLNVSFARETEVSDSNKYKDNTAPPAKQSKKEIEERIQSPIILSRTPFYDFSEKLKKLYEESHDLQPTLVEATDMDITPINDSAQREQKSDYLFSNEPKRTTLKSSSNSYLESSPTIPVEQEPLIDKIAASSSRSSGILVQEVNETVEKTLAPTRILSHAKSLEKLQKEALNDKEGRRTGNVPPNPMAVNEFQPKLNEEVLMDNRVSKSPPEEKDVAVLEKTEPARRKESQECTSETKLAFTSLKQSTPVEKNSSLRRSTLELYLETPYRREISKSIDFDLSGYATSGVDKERYEVKLESPKEDALAPTPNSFPENAEKLKRLSQSVPAFLQDDTDGRETDSASESSFQIGRHKKSPSSLTNLSGSSGMASMSSVSGSVMSMYSGDFGNIDVKGEIEVSIDYVEQLKELLIYIYQCKDLSVADAKKQRSDPYVKAYLLPEKSKMGKRKTAVKKKTLNPVYNEILRYKIPKQSLVTQTLNLSVWHRDVLGRNSFLGEVNLNLEKWDWSSKQRNWYPLEPRTPAAGIGLENRGEIKLSLQYIPHSPTGTGAKPATTGEVHIWIKECLQLPMLRENKINSFVKCTILPDTSRKSRQKTRTVDKTPNPIFNHTMVYDGFKEEDLREACVELTVWDHNKLSNHFIGGLRLGLGTGKSYGTAVDWMDSSHEESTMWERMITSPNTWIEGMLPLRMFKMAKLAK
ncbi:synaptotagmin-like protein 2 isoform X5 [Mixophyes fleayi]|uniref:synaptotagmin-like protein 2 isoform X5 n=1 Tax=Mixophyes fleayi TaxID=3061075 RepID=UPI003F4DEB01